ncbi:protein-L-isoaspartate O-methyltransferase family protein [Qipengyuania sp. ASV99]|uniref:protein-L-isoaspartate O-methyltransferase family protein n=1 Tax=Qipengyuania sp. ASV99 TaxID=3399681 RepID=UPI003A4C6D5A
MIDSQLRTSGVNEEFVLARMMAVPREEFLPEDKVGLAYIDRSIALSDSAHLAAPLFYGKLLLEAAPLPSDRALVVEAGTGYLAELLRPLVGEVTVVGARDAAAGKLPNETFSLVLVDGAMEQLPEALASKVEDGGRVVSGVLLRQVTRLAAGRRIAGQVALQPVEDLGIPVLSAFDAPKSWTF